MLAVPNGSFELNSFISNNNQIKPIPIDVLMEYHNHPFKLYSGERRDDMIESIKQNGILNPIIVQPLKDGKYEILSGHNRVECAKQVGLNTIPAIIKEGLTEEEAEIYVMETNMMQRSFSELLVSEQATILQYRNSKMFSQGKRNDIVNELKSLEDSSTLSHGATKLSKRLSTMEKLGVDYSMSKSQVARTIRINYLIPELKELVDTHSLLFIAGVELSYISEEYQRLIYQVIETFPKHKKITQPLARTLRSTCTNQKDLNFNQIRDILVSNSEPIENRPVKISLDRNVYYTYFDNTTSKEEVSSIISEALKEYFS